MVQGHSERGPEVVKCNTQPLIPKNFLGPPLNLDILKQHSQSDL